MNKMMMGQFIEQLEAGNPCPCYRRIIVREQEMTRANGAKYLKKVPRWEKNDMTPAEIAMCRGYDVKNQNPDQQFTDYSLSLKHMPGIWVIDIDTKADEVLEKPLPQMLIDAGCYSTETNKGYHFYIKCPDAPTDFSNEIEVFNDFKGDFLGRDLGCNVWEKKTRELDGNHLYEIAWDDLKQHINLDKLNEESKAEKKKRLREEKRLALIEKKKADAAPDPEGTNEPFSDGQIDSYLSRINNSEGQSKHYDDWFKVGAILFNIYDGKVKGQMKFQDWSSKSPKFDEDQNEKTWEDYKSNHPDPLGWKTLRWMANKDNPTNIYQSAFNDKSADGFEAQKDEVALLMNERIMWNRSTKEIIQVYDDISKTEEGRWGSYNSTQMREEMEKYSFVAEGANGKPREFNPFTLWQKSQKRKEVRCIEFDPSNPDNPHIFNLWQGYNITAEDAAVCDIEDARPLIDHIYNIWCNCNEEHFDYIINWFAHTLQRPWHKMGVLLALQSEEGAGKGVVMETIAKIMGGAHFTATANANSIMGDFNGGLEAKVLVDLDEAVWGGDISKMGKMKNLISEQSQEVNKKHKEAYKIKNTTNFMITTNNDLFAGVEKGARRYACFRLDDRYAGVATQATNAYFKSLRGGSKDSCPSDAVCGGFAKFLYSRDLSSWHCRELPRTALLQDQIERGFNNTIRWWKDMLVDGRFNLPDYEMAYKNCIGWDGPVKKTEYQPEMEWYGFIKDGINGRKTTEKYKEIVGPMKFWQKKDFNGSIHPHDGETKKQYLKRVYQDPSKCSVFHRFDMVQKDGGTVSDPLPREYIVQWEGKDILERRTKLKVIYEGYYPKYLYKIYSDAVKAGRCGHSKNPETYNAWCQKMRKCATVNQKRHGSGKNQDITWEVLPLSSARQTFNETQQWNYCWNEAEEVAAKNGGVIVEYNEDADKCLIGDSDEEPEEE